MQDTSKSWNGKKPVTVFRRKNKSHRQSVLSLKDTEHYVNMMCARQKAIKTRYSLIPCIKTTLEQMQRIFEVEFPNVDASTMFVMPSAQNDIECLAESSGSG